MSTLTKILIVLLVFASLFLSAQVVTYVSMHENWKAKHDGLYTRFQAADERADAAVEERNRTVETANREKEQLSGRLAALDAENVQLKTDYQNAEREKAMLLQKVNNWTSVVEDFTKTNEQQSVILGNTLAEIDRVQETQLRQQRELEETTAVLLEKMAYIETLEADKRQLNEAKSQIQAQLDDVLQNRGQVAARPVTVTSRDDSATMARQTAAPVRDISLSGNIVDVDLANSLVSINLGSADGVRQGMRFHVIRGSEFVSDILVLEVEPDQAVGVLELVQKNPQVGDNITTNF